MEMSDRFENSPEEVASLFENKPMSVVQKEEREAQESEPKPISQTPETPETPEEPVVETPPKAPVKETPVVEEEAPAALTHEQLLQQERERNEALMRQIEVLSQQSFSGAPKAEPTSPATEQPPVGGAGQGTPQVGKAAPAGIGPFITAENFQEIFTSPEKMNEVLMQIYAASVEHSIHKMVPAVVTTVQQELEVQSMVNDYFRANDDLIPARSFMKIVALELSKTNPTMPYPELLEKAGQETRTRLGIMRKQAQQVAPTEPMVPAARSRRPAMAPGSRARSAPKELPQQKQLIADLFD